ncbi:MAG TPA: sigma-70 family RNA polymerase sigma factor, partial [Myxococcaceae bacterium]|nr:sigma-70 family RNA polymerase sigma factor [Myxococcaceae bacterium]
MDLEECLREYGPALWRVVSSYAARGPEHDDIAQEVLLAVWQALPRFRGESSLKTFVLRIAHNRCLSLAWQRARRPSAASAELAHLPDPRPAVDEQVAARQRTKRLFEHLRTLPLGQRQVLGLALEGLSHTEI